MTTLADVPTPSLLLDRPRLLRNARAMRDRVQGLGAALRPHVKTSKCIEVARILTDGAAGGITVSTLAEARYFHAAGFRDVLYAVGIAPGKLPDVAALVRDGCDLKILLDSVEAADAVGAFLRANPLPLRVLIEMDTDGHRAGVDPDDPLLLAIAERLRAGGAEVAGVLTHAGGSYGGGGPAALEQAAENERARLVDAANRLRAAGHACPIVSVGSTPTARYARSFAGVTEVRAGVYAFGDLFQAGIGTCSLDDVAIAVVGTVIGHKRSAGRIITDTGFLSVSKDRATASLPVDWLYGAICPLDRMEPWDDLVLSGVNQEHGIVTARTGETPFERLPIGSRFRVLPNHACATAAAHDRYYVTDGGLDVVATWSRINGW
jgi:D-serine deaminase-like pyridoxal phosphate-dependent protein